MNIISGQEVKVSFSNQFTSPGVKNIIVTAQNGNFRKTSYSRVSIIDESSLEINVDAPEEARYGEDAQVKFSVERTSLSTPKNVVVQLEFQGAERKWFIETLDNPNNFDVKIQTSGFTFNNEFKIRVSYEDEVGKKYYLEEKFTIKMTDLSLKDKIIVGLNAIGFAVVSLFS